ncbi:hypothetical protein KIH77_01865 [Bifidobacterium sp. 82T24]|uniref:arsenate reductase/protein-tyrosine-phosphatase family protein n=1 Tax=Bifidobacterium pluvialisilvae TaxID=2834436 RepID=UPI001C56EFFB|nr:hypothetical protein [Bifidobacterium pluvialisilvae]MBW3087491.1 hypothetical protein [Bifidobacterium pluvialisilvae]
MHILMVCSGNVCRSPMAEYMMRDALRRRGVSDIDGDGIAVSSAGLLRLSPRPMDGTCMRMLADESRIDGSNGVDPAMHLSTPIYDTPYMRSTGTNILVLCFERDHIDEILLANPSLVRSTFLMTEFAELCTAARRRGDFDAIDPDSPDDAASRLLTVMRNAPFLRPGLPPAADVPDPFHRSLNDYRNAYDAIRECIADIVSILP